MRVSLRVAARLRLRGERVCRGLLLEPVEGFLLRSRDTGLVACRSRPRRYCLPQAAIAFLLTGGLNVFPLVGAATPDEFLDLCGAFDLHLTAGERAYLDLRTDDPTEEPKG